MFCIEINHSASNQTCLMNLVLLLLEGNVKSNTYLFVCLFVCLFVYLTGTLHKKLLHKAEVALS